MDHTIAYDKEGNMYLEDVPGYRMEDKDLTDEEICEKYRLISSNEYSKWDMFNCGEE